MSLWNKYPKKKTTDRRWSFLSSRSAFVKVVMFRFGLESLSRGGVDWRNFGLRHSERSF